MIILGIETSCDESAVAIYDSDSGLLAHQLYSQAARHAEYGGVVPELASRDHVRKLVPLMTSVLDAARIPREKLDGVAYTAGPGLLGALLVGASMAQGLAYAWRVPALGIHHLEGHLLAPMLEARAPAFPFIALLVSGGHTLLARVDGVGRYRILGQSLDDAAGEAFDKTAKLLGLPYPGGPALAELAEAGCASSFRLPRPMLARPGLDFSFSGLKTAVSTALRETPGVGEVRADLAASFQAAVVDTLAGKCERALEQTGETRLVVAGGVGANRALRARLKRLMVERGGEVYYPRLEFCTDNAAMIAYAGAQRWQGRHTSPPLRVRARWSLDSLRAPCASVLRQP